MAPWVISEDPREVVFITLASSKATNEDIALNGGVAECNTLS